MNTLTLSVIITTYNSGDTIERCLSSLYPYQKAGYISEVIIVDGYSTDNTLDVVKKYPVKILFEKGREICKNSIIRSYYGRYNAQNQGWKASSGNLIMFLDSDAYLGEDFFPEALKFFEDPKLGVLGCLAKAHVSNQITKVMGQLWEFHKRMMKAVQGGSTKFLSSTFFKLVDFGSRRIVTGGPCYIVRRRCLEDVGGFDILGDVGVALHAQEKGWKYLCWIDSPVYHFPRETLHELVDQRYFWGQVGAFMPVSSMRILTSHFFRIAGFLILGLMFTFRFRDSLYMKVLPLMELYYLKGYLVGLKVRHQKNEIIIREALQNLGFIRS
jgi:cellulose synthase/poly-beta-1,6-N-acetylglucosamine synthase-like glycosyltransferase